MTQNERDADIQEIALQVREIHTVIYKNGFQARIKKIEQWIDNYPEYKERTCIGVPLIQKHMDEIKLVEAEKEKRRTLRMAIVGVAVALLAALPGYIALALDLGAL